MGTLAKTWKILIVEDGDDDFDFAKMALEKCTSPIVVERARDGQYALDVLRSDNVAPDLIFLDLNMPQIDGFEFLKLAKADEQLRTIPVIVMTTSRAEDDVLAAYRCQASSYIVKPSSFSALVDTMKAIEAYWFDVAALPVLVE